MANWEDVAEGVWIKEVSTDGPTVGVMGGIHGNEQAGGIVVDHEIEHDLWPIEAGRVVAMIGSPEALKIDRRHTGKTPNANLNRFFRSLKVDDDPDMYEVQRAQELLPFLELCDASLDLHEHDTSEPAGTSTLMIAEKPSLDLAKAIGAKYISHGWIGPEPGSTDGHMYEIGKQGLALETGWRGTTFYNRRIGDQAVRRLLFVKGINDQEVAPVHAAPTFVRLLSEEEYELPVTDPSFEWARSFQQMEQVQPGELVAINGGKKVYVPDISGKLRIIFPDDYPEIGAEFHLLGVDTPDPTTV